MPSLSFSREPISLTFEANFGVLGYRPVTLKFFFTPGYPGVFVGPPDIWQPPEPDELEVVELFLDLDGTQVEIPFYSLDENTQTFFESEILSRRNTLVEPDDEDDEGVYLEEAP